MPLTIMDLTVAGSILYISSDRPEFPCGLNVAQKSPWNGMGMRGNSPVNPPRFRGRGCRAASHAQQQLVEQHGCVGLLFGLLDERRVATTQQRTLTISPIVDIRRPRRSLYCRTKWRISGLTWPVECDRVVSEGRVGNVDCRVLCPRIRPFSAFCSAKFWCPPLHSSEGQSTQSWVNESLVVRIGLDLRLMHVFAEVGRAASRRPAGKPRFHAGSEQGAADPSGANAAHICR